MSFTAFRERLQVINASTLSEPLPDLSEEMARTTQRLRTEFGDISRGAKDSRGIAVAVVACLKSRQLPDSYRDFKLLCFGAASEYGAPLTRLIEETPLFLSMLETLESLAAEPRKFRRCYQGLLKTYFRYPGHVDTAKGRSNWLLLREFLARHCLMLKNHQPVMEWTQALYEHRNLLGDSPCKPYGEALLRGDTGSVEELKARLGIDDDTWVMQELILAPVQAAVELKDESFIPLVLPLVRQLEGHPLLVGRGIAMLLRRYHTCLNRQEHHALREAALREWKSPWLESNRPLWHAQIGLEATQMVSLWLKKRTIQDFFELLQSDGQADRQRMEFWLKYAEFMDEIWLALGHHSLYNNKSDYRRIRQQMEGRYMALEGGNYANDNAFLMRIGGYVFIEFGKHSNACHVFDASNLPFKARQKSVLGTQDGLKNTYHPGHRGKLMHRDGWQWDFANFLSSKAEAVPGQERKPERAPLRSSTSKLQAVPETRSEVLSSGKVNLSELETYCALHGHIIVDHRSKGGALWVQGTGFSSDVVTVLRQAGFQYKEGKGWWLA